MEYRSMSFHQGWPDLELVRLGAELGFNDICFQTEGGTVKPLFELRKRADEKGYFSLAKKLGMSISLWVHELEDYEEAWGPVSLDNKSLWAALRERYRLILTELLPEVDYLVLTVVETQIRMTDFILLQRLIETLHDQCSRYGKKLIFRTFVWHPDEEKNVAKALEKLPEDVIIMSKCVPQDWHMRSINDRLIGNVGERKQIVEVDIAGEYFRLDHVANCFTNLLEKQFAYWKEKKCQGISVRVDRGWKPWEYQCTVLHQAQEVNLWALGYLSTGKPGGVDEAWMDYAFKYFGHEAAAVMIEVLRSTGDVIAEALCVEHETFGDTRQKIPAGTVMQGTSKKQDPRYPIPFHEASTARVISDEDDYIWSNPFHSNWSVFRWDAEYFPEYRKIRMGDISIINNKEASYAHARFLADKSLEMLAKVKEILPDGAYPFYKFKLEENKFHLMAMCEAALAWLKASNMLYCYVSDRAQENLLWQVLDHLRNLSLLQEKYEEHMECWFQGKYHMLRRGEYIDINGFINEFKRYWQIG